MLTTKLSKQRDPGNSRLSRFNLLIPSPLLTAEFHSARNRISGELHFNGISMGFRVFSVDRAIHINFIFHNGMFEKAV
ncbi:MAG TPA: hypothetical protein VM554_15200 [Acidisarcina sp.]|nr:hypothetical protein [Acidisarcina sp.]